MKKSVVKLKLGIVGCGVIGGRIALSVSNVLKQAFVITALYDIDLKKSAALSQSLEIRRVVLNSIDEVIAASDVVVECVNTADAGMIIKKALSAGKKVLAMSVGRVFTDKTIFSPVRGNRSDLFLPSGAIAGLDAVKAASLGGIKSLSLTTVKPPEGFKGNMFLEKKGIILDKIQGDTVLFDGGVDEAVKKFPQNINVAAALALASGGAKVRVRIIASPGSSKNSHEIVCIGASGTIRAVTENVPCPDNPKTSYLAVLSGIQVLKQLSSQIKIGT
jgi:aspartate dehydrogenase